MTTEFILIDKYGNLGKTVATITSDILSRAQKSHILSLLIEIDNPLPVQEFLVSRFNDTPDNTFFSTSLGIRCPVDCVEINRRHTEPNSGRIKNDGKLYILNEYNNPVLLVRRVIV